MKRFATYLIGISLTISCSAVNGQTVVDLSRALEDGAVVLEKANGTGASSGSSVDGVLANATEREISIDVFISKPLYMVNRGAGQNMVATQVYGGDGGYMRDGERSFITLKPRESSPVKFIAYCADFEKENPTSQEGFSIGQLPALINQVMTNIANFERANPETDTTIAAQVAIWLAQGQSADEIRMKFQFSAEDERLAREFLR